MIEEYKEEMFGCGHSGVGAGPLVSCGAIPLADIELRLVFVFFILLQTQI
jgi:hypothetical protein